MNVPLWILLIMVCASLGVTFDIRFSLGKVSGVFLGAFLFWSLARWLITPGRVKAGVAAFMLAGAGLAIVGLLGTQGSGKFAPLRVLTARLPLVIRGLPGAEEGFNPNAVAGALVLFLPLQVALLASRSHVSLLPGTRTWWAGVWTAVQAISLALTASAVLLMQSRGAWVGLAVAAVAFLALHGRRTRVITAAALGGAILLMAATGPRDALEQVIGPSAPGLLGSASDRLDIWSRALYGIQDFPLTGMGMNVFRRLMPVIYPLRLLSPDTDATDVAHAHNHLLQAALDLGIPGLVAYCAIWLVVGSLLVRVYRRSSQPLYRAMAGGLGAGLIAHFMFGMTDAIALGAKVGVLFWMSLALAVGLHQVAIGGKQGKSPAPHQSD